MNVGIYIYNEVEVLDFSGPFEVFSTASRICGNEDPFSVFLVGETGEMVTARAGYRVQPLYGFHNHPNIDVLIVAGGVHYDELTKKRVIDWITETAGKTKLTASVCTGAFLLAEAKILTSHHATTHWEDIPDLKKNYPDLTVESSRWIDEGSVVTSGGISAGIDMSLHLVERLHSLELAEKTARQMEFTWTKNISNQEEKPNRIEKRAIEALAVAPLIQALSGRISRDEIFGILREVNQQEAFRRGQSRMVSSGENVIGALIEDVAGWGEGGFWEMDVLEQTEKTYFFNVTRCPYYEKYKELGLLEFGVAFSCCRDEPFARGFHPQLKLVRTQTIMEGADYCDFRYYLNTE